MEQQTLDILSIPKEEQETTLNHDAESNTWSIYSCESTQITKLRKQFTEDEFTKVSLNREGRIIELWIDGLENNRVSYRKKSKPMSDEQREEIAERFRKARGTSK